MKQLKIVIADDSELIRDLLRNTFIPIEGLTLAGEAANGTEAVQLVKELNPDLLVLDLSMPGMSGIEAIKETRKECPSTVIIILTAYQSDFIEEVCLKAGANYFLNKSEVHELVEICRLELTLKV